VTYLPRILSSALEPVEILNIGNEAIGRLIKSAEEPEDVRKRRGCPRDGRKRSDHDV
jgi:hypothetical protein